MGFIAHNQIPVRDLQLFLQLRVSGKLIKASNAVVNFRKYVTGYCRFKTIIGEYLKAQMKFGEQFVLPLLSQVAR